MASNPSRSRITKALKKTSLAGSRAPARSVAASARSPCTWLPCASTAAVGSRHQALDPIQGTSRFLTHIFGPCTEVGVCRSIAVVLQPDKVSLGSTHHEHHQHCSRPEAHL